jgi:N-sulfoglucosamine sulfohydrolase
MRPLLIMAAVLLASCSQGEEAPAESEISSPQSQSAPPNILLCLADDWGWPHAGAYGDEVVQTPAFDRIAREGVLFHHAYVSSPSCTPSRNAAITGKYHWELGPGANLWSTLPVEHESFMHLLADKGYLIGRDPRKSWGPGKLESWQKVHLTHPMGPVFKGGLAEFLETTEARTKPFAFWLGTPDPHRPYKLNSGKESGMDLSKVHLFSHFPDTETSRGDVADYYFEVQRWDKKVANAIAALEQHGLLENTIIIMTGDHGMPFPRGKGNLYDSGVRVPFAVCWPAGCRRAGRSGTSFPFPTSRRPCWKPRAFRCRMR